MSTPFIETMPPVSEPSPFEEILRPAAAGRKIERPSGARGTRHWVRVMLSVLIPLVVVVGGVFVADMWARASVAGPIQDSLAAAFQVEPSAVSVDLGGDLALVQLINTRFPIVKATVSGVELGGATGVANVVMTGVSTDRTMAVEAIDATVVIPPDQLTGLVSAISELTPSAITVSDGEVHVATTLDLGIVGEFDVIVDLRPDAGPGSITFTPISLQIDGSTVPASDIRALPVLGEFIAPSIGSREYCVADRLPMALNVDRFRASDAGAVLTLRGVGVIVDETLARPGLCG